MTIADLLRGAPTLTQYAIMQRADLILRERAGRYYGGPLTDIEVKRLKGEEDE